MRQMFTRAGLDICCLSLVAIGLFTFYQLGGRRGSSTLLYASLVINEMDFSVCLCFETGSYIAHAGLGFIV